MRTRLAVVALALGTLAYPTARGHAAIETGSETEGIKLVNAQMVRELTTRAAHLGTSTGTSDTTFVGYTPGFKGPGNYWSIYSGFGKDGYKRPQNGQPNRGTWDWEEPVNGDSLQGWWPLINLYASSGGLTLPDRQRPWWAIDYGNMANYVINQNNGRTYGVIGVWHRDGGTNQPAPAGLITPKFTPPSGNFAAWMGLRAHGDNSVADGKTGNPFNEDLLQYVGFTSVSSTGNDYGFPGYGSQMDQMLYRDINFQGKKTANLTIRFKFNTRMSTGSGNNPVTDTGWFDCDPLAFTGGANNPQLNNFISATDAGAALSPRDSFMVYIGAGVDTNLWLGSDGVRRPVYDKQRRWFGEVLHWDRDPSSPPSNPQPRFYKELLSVGGNWPAVKTGTGYVDTTFVIPNAALQPYLAKNNKIRLVFRVKTNRFFDDTQSSYSSDNKGAAIVDQVSYQLGSNPEVVFGDFENASDIDNDPDVGAVDAWKSTGKPPSIYHHVHLFSDLVYEDLCGAKGDISRICNMSGNVISAGDHDNSEAAGGLVDGTATRERNDGIMSPTIQLAGPYNGPGGVNVIGLRPYTGVDQPGDINPSEDFYVQYEIYTGIMDPFTKGNLWRFAMMSYPSPSKLAKGSYPAWGQMRFPGAIFFNPDKQCFEDLEPGYGFALVKTSNATTIPDSLKIFLGKTQQCFRFGVSTGCSPTDGCYWDNVCFAIIDGTPAQLGVDIWNWIQDSFPANETAGLPGVASAFDTCAALIKTGINTAQPTNTNLRFDVPGDSTVIYSSPNTSRVDMVFRILPGPGNYEPKGRPDLGTIRRIPTSAAVVTKGDGSFWDQYRQVPGDFASPNAVTLHHNAVGGWDPNVWNSARCDTQEINLAALQPSVLGGPVDPSAWMSTYHESDPHFNALGILKNKCYIRCTTCNLPDRRCDGGQPDNYTVSTGPGGTPGTTTTKEFTKIIPDGLLTPGSHVEYFFRDQKDSKAPGPMDGMIPDTNVVFPQISEGSTDGHRWQEFSVLPNRWKDPTYRHPVTGLFGLGPACLLVIDNNDRRGNERVWKAVSDTIGSTPQRYWGASDGYHARGSGGNVNNPADNLRGKDGGAGWVSEHIGQAGSGSSWDMYQVKASESLTTSAGSPGNRLANRTGSAAQQIVIDKSSRQGPTPAMLNAYYVIMLFLSGDLNSGVLGPFRNRSQNDAGLIINWLQAGSTSVQNRGFWAIGDGFAESNIFADKLPPFDLMISYLGCDIVDPNYTFASGDTRALVDYRLLPAWQGKPAGQVELFGIRNLCLFTNDVLKVEGAGLPTLGSVTSHYYGPGGPHAAGVFKDWAPSSPWKTLVDGWDIEHLTGVHDVDTRDRNGYFYKIFVNIWSKLCRVQGTPIIPLEVPTMSDGGLVDFVNLGNNPVVSGSATIHLGLSRADRVEVKIFDVSGRLIRTLADRPFPAGEHDLVWDGVDNAGRQVARGVYFTRVSYRSGLYEGTMKLTVLR